MCNVKLIDDIVLIIKSWSLLLQLQMKNLLA